MAVEPDHQKLIHKGKHLKNEKNLEELKLKDNDCLVLMILKKKPKKKPVVTAPVEPVNPTPVQPVQP